MEKDFSTDPYYARLREFLDASRSESDRGRALIAASLIEEMLEEIIRAFLLKERSVERLFTGANPPLSTLSAKASTCRAMALISIVEFRDIEVVRKIRNAFAHNVLCSFDDQQISDRANSLTVGMSILDSLEDGNAARVSDARQRFGMATTSLVGNLYNRSHWVRENRIQERDWPA